MTKQKTPKLIPLGRARRQTRASFMGRVPEINPSELYAEG